MADYGWLLSGLLAILLLSVSLSCDSVDTCCPDTSSDPKLTGTYVLQNVDPPNHHWYFRGGSVRISAGTLEFDDERYSWRIVLEHNKDLPPDSIVSEGTFTLRPPLVQFGKDDPFFGRASRDSITVYSRSAELPRQIRFREWLFASNNDADNMDWRLPTFSNSWASGEYVLVQAGSRKLPILGWNSSVGDDSLMSGSVAFDQNRYVFNFEMKLVPHRGEVRTRTETLSGYFHQSGELMIFDAKRSFRGSTWPFFGVVGDTTLTLYRVPSWLGGPGDRSFPGGEDVLRFERQQ